MENKQTAVNWLFEQVDNLDWRNLQGDKKLEIFEQAKAMEKEQIIDTYIHVASEHCDFSLHFEIKQLYTKQAEQYYNETYTND